MQTVKASVILEDAYRLIGWDPDQLEPRQEQIARNSLSLALQEVWEAWWWEELMTCAQFSGATVYSATTLTVVDAFYYFPATQLFYQCLAAGTGIDPAMLDVAVGYTINFTHWALATAAPTAGDYSATSIYTLGAQARNPADGLFYQFIGESVTLLNPTVIASPDTVFSYTAATRDHNFAVGMTVQIIGGGIQATVLVDGIFDGGPGSPKGFSGSLQNAAGDSPVGSILPAGSAFAVVSTPISNPVVWHALIAFTPEVSVAAGAVRMISRHDPRNSNNPCPADFEKTATGYRIPGWNTGVPWVWYRTETPILTGDQYDVAVAYDDQSGNSTSFIGGESGAAILTEG